MIGSYRKSLKLPEAEELFDLLFYRPAAHLFVRAVHRTPITPNQVTGLSLAAALAAAWCYAAGSLDMLVPAAAWYAVANILDCADGQLARIQGSGTPHGRIVDGVADYAGTVAVFLGIGIGLSALGIHLWWLVVAAGLSSALHAVVFDHRQGAYIAAARGEGDHHAREMEKFAEGPATGGRPPGGAVGLIVRLYVGYMRLQHRIVSRLSRPVDGGAYDLRRNTPLIRLWSFLGPTTNRTALIAFSLIARLDLYLWGVVVIGNLWLISLLVIQSQMEGSARAGNRRAPGESELP